MRRPYDRRAGEKKEKERAGFTPDVTGRRGKLFEPRRASRLTLSSQCEKRPPSNAASGKSAGTGHDAQRTPYRPRKVGRRHSPRPPPPAESPAHFDSIARRRRDHIHLGSLDRVHAPVSGTDPCGVAASCRAVASHRLSGFPSPGPAYWFGRSGGNGLTSGGSIPAGARRRTVRCAPRQGTNRPATPTERRTVRTQPTWRWEIRATGRGYCLGGG